MEAGSEAGTSSVILPPGSLSTLGSAGQGRGTSQVRWFGESVGREKGKLATAVFETSHKRL